MAIFSVNRITIEEFQDTSIFLELLAANQPFVIQGFPYSEGVYTRMLALFQRSNINLFNVLGKNAESGEIRNYHELLESITCLKNSFSKSFNMQNLWKEYSELYSKYLINSKVLDTTQDFSVQLDILPDSELMKSLVKPASWPYTQILKRMTRHTYLNTVLNVSRSNVEIHKKSKNIHAHNYDTFSIIGEAGIQTNVYLFPPEYYLGFNTRVVSATTGILLLLPDDNSLHDSILEEAYVYDDVKPGDIVYTPPFWFHCFHHNGEYMNLANGEFFPHLLKARLKGITHELYGDDWQEIAFHAQKLQHFSIRTS